VEARDVRLRRRRRRYRRRRRRRSSLKVSFLLFSSVGVRGSF